VLLLGNGHGHHGEEMEGRAPTGPAARGRRSRDHPVEHLREPSFQPTVEVVHL
jgi:hypothetical protein